MDRNTICHLTCYHGKNQHLLFEFAIKRKQFTKKLLVLLFHVQVHAMEGMVLSFQVGAVEVKANDFQQACLQYPKSIIDKLEDQLPRKATTECDQLSNDMKVLL